MKLRFISVTGILALAATLFMAGCKEDTIVKAGITPGANNLGTESIGDTLTVISKTVFLDKFKTSEKLAGFPVVQAIGTITDPFFGKTNAGTYFQVVPTTNDFNFSAGSYTIDSAVLILPYSGFAWGNRNTPKPQKFRVYRVTESMSATTDYYSNQSLSVSNDLLGETIINLESALKDTPTVVGKNTGFKHMRIPLSQNFINEVTGMIPIANVDDFTARFNGFYVAPDSTYNMSNGADLLPYVLFDGGGDYARVAIAFYYRENGGTETKTAFFNYVRDKTANFNRISRNVTGFPAAALIHSYTQSPNISNDTVLLQNEPGCAIDIRVPGLKNLPTASIMKAELVITKIKSGFDIDSLPEPNRITPVGVNDAGEEYEIVDYTANDITAAVIFVDGNKRAEKDAQGNDITTYRINIPREVQKAIIDKRNELHLRIKGTKGFPGAYRLVAGGRNHSSYKMQLNIVYAKPK